jgi:hypothetical protein
MPLAAAAGTTAAVALGRWGANAAQTPGLQALVWLVLLPAPFVIAGAWGTAYFAGRSGSVLVWAAAALALVALGFGGRAAFPVAGYTAAGLIAARALIGTWRRDAAIAGVLLMLAPAAVWTTIDAPVAETLAAEAEQAHTALAASLPADLEPAEREATLSEYGRRLDEIVSVAVAVWPGCLALGLTAVAAVLLGVVAFAGRLVTGRRIGSPLASFARWRLPFYLVWLLAGGLALTATRIEPLTNAGINIVLYGAVLLAVQGVAVQAHVVARAIGPRWQIVYWVAAGLFFAPLVLASGVLLGLVDQWFDVRRLGARGNEP